MANPSPSPSPSGGGGNRINLASNSREFRQVVENHYVVNAMSGQMERRRLADQLSSRGVTALANAINTERASANRQLEEINRQLQSTAASDSDSRTALLRQQELATDRLAAVDATLNQINNIAESQLDATAQRERNRATNQQTASRMSPVISRAVDAASGAASATIGRTMNVFGSAVGGLGGTMRDATRTIGESVSNLSSTMSDITGSSSKSADQMGSILGRFGSALTSGSMLLGVFGAAVGMAVMGLKNMQEKMDIARSMGGEGNAAMVKSIGEMQIRTQMDPEALKGLSDTLQRSYGISLSRNQVEMEKVAVKQRLTETVMGKEYADAQMEAMGDLKGILSGGSASEQMDSLQNATLALAKTMGVSNKYALDQIKAIHENTKQIAKGLDKGQKAALNKELQTMEAGWKAMGMTEDQIKEMRESMTQAFTEQGSQEAFTKAGVVASDPKTAAMFAEAAASSGMNSQQAMDALGKLASNQGNLQLAAMEVAKSQGITLAEATTRVARAVEVSKKAEGKYAQTAADDNDSGRVYHSVALKMDRLFGDLHRDAGGWGAGMNAEKSHKEVLKAGESKGSLEKLMAASGVKSQDEREKKLQSLIDATGKRAEIEAKAKELAGGDGAAPERIAQMMESAYMLQDGVAANLKAAGESIDKKEEVKAAGMGMNAKEQEAYEKYKTMKPTEQLAAQKGMGRTAVEKAKDSLTDLANKFMVALEPVVTKIAEDVVPVIEKITKYLGEIKFEQYFEQAYSFIKKFFGETLPEMSANFTKFFNEKIMPAIGEAGTGLLNFAKQTFPGFTEEFDAIGAIFKDFSKKSWPEIMAELGTVFGKIFDKMGPKIAEFIEEIPKTIEQFVELAKTIGIAIASLLALGVAAKAASWIKQIGSLFGLGGGGAAAAGAGGAGGAAGAAGAAGRPGLMGRLFGGAAQGAEGAAGAAGRPGIVSRAGSAIWRGAEAVSGGIGRAAGGVARGVGNVVGGAVRGAMAAPGALVRGAMALPGQIAAAPGRLALSAGNAVGHVMNAGTRTMQGVRAAGTAIANAPGAISGAVSRVAAAAPGAISGAAGQGARLIGEGAGHAMNTMGKLGEAFGKFAKVAGPLAVIAQVGMTVKGAFDGVTKASETFGKAAAKNADDLEKAGISLEGANFDAASKTWTDAAGNVIAKWDESKNAYVDANGEMIRASATFSEKVSGAIGGAVEAMTFGLLKGDETARWVQVNFGATWDGIKSIWDGFVVEMQAKWELFKQMMAPFIANLQIIWDDIKRIFIDPFKAAFQLFTGDIGGAVETLKGVWTTIGKLFLEDVPALIVSWFKGIYGTVGLVIKDMWMAIERGFTDLGIWWDDFSFMDSVVTPMWEGIKSAFKSLGNMFGDLMDWLLAKLPETLTNNMGLSEDKKKSVNQKRASNEAEEAADKKKKKEEATTQIIQKGDKGEDLLKLLKKSGTAESAGAGTKGNNIDSSALQAMSKEQLESLQKMDGYFEVSEKSRNEITALLQSRAAGTATQVTTVAGQKVEPTKQVDVSKLKDSKEVDAKGKAKKTLDEKSLKDLEGKSKEELSEFYNKNAKELDKASRDKLDALTSKATSKAETDAKAAAAADAKGREAERQSRLTPEEKAKEKEYADGEAKIAAEKQAAAEKAKAAEAERLKKQKDLEKYGPPTQNETVDATKEGAKAAKPTEASTKTQADAPGEKDAKAAKEQAQTPAAQGSPTVVKITGKLGTLEGAKEYAAAAKKLNSIDPKNFEKIAKENGLEAQLAVNLMEFVAKNGGDIELSVQQYAEANKVSLEEARGVIESAQRTTEQAAKTTQDAAASQKAQSSPGAVAQQAKTSADAAAQTTAVTQAQTQATQAQTQATQASKDAEKTTAAAQAQTQTAQAQVAQAPATVQQSVAQVDSSLNILMKELIKVTKQGFLNLYKAMTTGFVDAGISEEDMQAAFTKQGSTDAFNNAAMIAGDPTDSGDFTKIAESSGLKSDQVLDALSKLAASGGDMKLAATTVSKSEGISLEEAVTRITKSVEVSKTAEGMSAAKAAAAIPATIPAVAQGQVTPVAGPVQPATKAQDFASTAIKKSDLKGDKLFSQLFGLRALKDAEGVGTGDNIDKSALQAMSIDQLKSLTDIKDIFGNLKVSQESQLAIQQELAKRAPPSSLAGQVQPAVQGAAAIPAVAQGQVIPVAGQVQPGVQGGVIPAVAQVQPAVAGQAQPTAVDAGKLFSELIQAVKAGFVSLYDATTKVSETITASASAVSEVVKAGFTSLYDVTVKEAETLTTSAATAQTQLTMIDGGIKLLTELVQITKDGFSSLSATIVNAATSRVSVPAVTPPGQVVPVAGQAAPVAGQVQPDKAKRDLASTAIKKSDLKGDKLLTQLSLLKVSKDAEGVGTGDDIDASALQSMSVDQLKSLTEIKDIFGNLKVSQASQLVIQQELAKRPGQVPLAGQVKPAVQGAAQTPAAQGPKAKDPAVAKQLGELNKFLNSAESAVEAGTEGDASDQFLEVAQKLQTLDPKGLEEAASKFGLSSKDVIDSLSAMANSSGNVDAMVANLQKLKPGITEEQAIEMTMAAHDATKLATEQVSIASAKPEITPDGEVAAETQQQSTEFLGDTLKVSREQSMEDNKVLNNISLGGIDKILEGMFKELKVFKKITEDGFKDLYTLLDKALFKDEAVKDAAGNVMTDASGNAIMERKSVLSGEVQGKTTSQIAAAGGALSAGDPGAGGAPGTPGAPGAPTASGPPSISGGGQQQQAGNGVVATPGAVGVQLPGQAATGGATGGGNLPALSANIPTPPAASGPPAAGGATGGPTFPPSGTGYKVQSGSINTQNMQPPFFQRFQMMTNEYNAKTGKKAIITDGWRSPEEQQRLWIKYGQNPKRVARPGYSLHEFGWAMDINSKEADEMASMGLLKKYGFERKIPGEPWHLTAIGVKDNEARSRVAGVSAAAAQGMQPVIGGAPAALTSGPSIPAGPDGNPDPSLAGGGGTPAAPAPAPGAPAVAAAPQAPTPSGPPPLPPAIVAAKASVAAQGNAAGPGSASGGAPQAGSPAQAVPAAVPVAAPAPASATAAGGATQQANNPVQAIPGATTGAAATPAATPATAAAPAAGRDSAQVGATGGSAGREEKSKQIFEAKLKELRSQKRGNEGFLSTLEKANIPFSDKLRYLKVSEIESDFGNIHRRQGSDYSGSFQLGTAALDAIGGTRAAAGDFVTQLNQKIAYEKKQEKEANQESLGGLNPRELFSWATSTAKIDPAAIKYMQHNLGVFGAAINLDAFRKNPNAMGVTAYRTPSGKIIDTKMHRQAKRLLQANAAGGYGTVAAYIANATKITGMQDVNGEGGFDPSALPAGGQEGGQQQPAGVVGTITGSGGAPAGSGTAAVAPAVAGATGTPAANTGAASTAAGTGAAAGAPAASSGTPAAASGGEKGVLVQIGVDPKTGAPITKRILPPKEMKDTLTGNLAQTYGTGGPGGTPGRVGSSYAQQEGLIASITGRPTAGATNPLTGGAMHSPMGALMGMIPFFGSNMGQGNTFGAPGGVQLARLYKPENLAPKQKILTPEEKKQLEEKKLAEEIKKDAEKKLGVKDGFGTGASPGADGAGSATEAKDKSEAAKTDPVNDSFQRMASPGEKLLDKTKEIPKTDALKGPEKVLGKDVKEKKEQEKKDPFDILPPETQKIMRGLPPMIQDSYKKFSPSTLVHILSTPGVLDKIKAQSSYVPGSEPDKKDDAKEEAKGDIKKDDLGLGKEADPAEEYEEADAKEEAKGDIKKEDLGPGKEADAKEEAKGDIKKEDLGPGKDKESPTSVDPFAGLTPEMKKLLDQLPPQIREGMKQMSPEMQKELLSNPASFGAVLPPPGEEKSPLTSGMDLGLSPSGSNFSADPLLSGMNMGLAGGGMGMLGMGMGGFGLDAMGMGDFGLPSPMARAGGVEIPGTSGMASPIGAGGIGTGYGGAAATLAASTNTTTNNYSTQNVQSMANVEKLLDQMLRENMKQTSHLNKSNMIDTTRAEQDSRANTFSLSRQDNSRQFEIGRTEGMSYV